MKALDVVGDLCIENGRTMDDIIGGVVQLIAKGGPQGDGRQAASARAQGRDPGRHGCRADEGQPGEGGGAMKMTAQPSRPPS